MTEAVELRADLTQFGGHYFLVGASPVALGIHTRRFEIEIEVAIAEWDRFMQLVAKLDDFAAVDQARRPQHGGGAHVVGRTTLVALSPPGWAAIFFGRWNPALRIGCR